MAIKIRLARGGSKKRPHYSIVVADSRSARDSKFIEKIGTYNPMLPRESQQRVSIKVDRAQHWLSVGAQPSDRVTGFLAELNLVAAPAQSVRPQKSAPKKKAQERAREEAALAEKKAEAAKAAAEAEAAAKAAPAPEPEAAPEVTAEAPAEEVPAESAAPAEEESAA
ncbi:MAG TPA: 30S ribosomal protein S16 [Alphaproteobacteria bacterium]|nr:30S ribosomal protein S16 [Rhodospirillaceae bacterium]HRJ12839.1 30S ribosomal protein S16 [Alphaproteobacteria bacterium]